MAPALGFSIPPITTWACRFTQEKNAGASRRIARKLHVRKLKHTVNKVLSLRDFARHSGEKNNLAVFIDFYCFYIIINIHCTVRVYQMHVSPSLRGRIPKQSGSLTMIYGLLPASFPAVRNDGTGLLTQPLRRAEEGLKALSSTAQGNALWIMAICRHSPARAKSCKTNRMSPLQGLVLRRAFLPQGVALCY
jgi:hypothetical protein